MRLRAGVLAGLLLGLAAPAAAPAAVRIGAEDVVVTAPGGARAVVTRSPFRLRFLDRSGRTVLSEVAGGAGPFVVPPVPRSQFGVIGPDGPALYAPLSFLVGTQRIVQTPASQWEGTLQSVTEGGLEYGARSVVSARADGGGVALVLATGDPTGRRLAVTIAPYRGGTLRVSARPTPDAGVAAMADSFSSPSGEAFHGFGGRHDALDEHGREFYDWLEQENISSGQAGGLTAQAPGAGSDYLFPNGRSAAYYVQSSSRRTRKP